MSEMSEEHQQVFNTGLAAVLGTENPFGRHAPEYGVWLRGYFTAHGKALDVETRVKKGLEMLMEMHGTEWLRKNVRPGTGRPVLAEINPSASNLHPVTYASGVDFNLSEFINSSTENLVEFGFEAIEEDEEDELAQEWQLQVSAIRYKLGYITMTGEDKARHMYVFTVRVPADTLIEAESFFRIDPFNFTDTKDWKEQDNEEEGQQDLGL